MFIIMLILLTIVLFFTKAGRSFCVFILLSGLFYHFCVHDSPNANEPTSSEVSELVKNYGVGADCHIWLPECKVGLYCNSANKCQRKY
jgi:hypothetical protein